MIAGLTVFDSQWLLSPPLIVVGVVKNVTFVRLNVARRDVEVYLQECFVICNHHASTYQDYSGTILETFVHERLKVKVTHRLMRHGVSMGLELDLLASDMNGNAYCFVNQYLVFTWRMNE